MTKITLILDDGTEKKIATTNPNPSDEFIEGVASAEGHDPTTVSWSIEQGQAGRVEELEKAAGVGGASKSDIASRLDDLESRIENLESN